MANSGYQTLTGSGRIAISATTYIKEINYYLSVLGNSEPRPSATVQRIMHAGWYAIGYHNQTNDGVTNDWYYFQEYFDFQYRDHVLPLNLVFGDSIFYFVQNGVTVRLIAYW